MSKESLIAFIRQYEILLGSGLIIVVMIILSFSFLSPNFGRANQIYSQQQELRQKLIILKEKDNRLSALDYAYYQGAFLKIGQVLPETKDYVSLFNTFDNLEKKTGVGILRTDLLYGVVSTTSASLLKASKTGAYAIPLGITIQGDSFSLQKFIDEFRSLSGRLITIEDIQWSDKGNGFMQVTINGRAFFYPLPITIGKVDTPLPKLSSSQEEILRKIAQITPEVAVSTTGEKVKVNVGKKNIFQ